MPAMLFVVSTNSIFKERIPDETYFFTWTGQMSSLGKGVQLHFTLCHTPKLLIFSPIQKKAIRKLKGRLMERLQQESKPLYSGRTLTRGGVLALDLSPGQDFPQLKGLVLCGNSIQTQHQPLYRLQILLFLSASRACLWKTRFRNKQQMLQILTELKRAQFNRYH